MKPSLKIAILLVSVGIAVAAYRYVKSTSATPSASGTVATSPSSNVATPSHTGNLLISSQWAYYQNNGAEGSKEDLAPAKVGLPPDATVVRIHVTKIAKQIFDVGYSYHFDAVSFAQGDTVTLRFKARSPAKSLIAPQMQLNRPHYDACWTKFIRLTPKWQDYKFTFTTAAYAPQDAALVFKLGQNTGDIDIANISLVRGDGTGKP